MKFTRFKALSDFSLSLDRVNVLVGPNNSGKSTVIGALRLLAAVLPGAQRRAPEWISLGTRRVRGYRISEDVSPISLENIHTEYETAESKVEFYLNNGNVLSIIGTPEGKCFLIPDRTSKSVNTAARMRTEYPIEVGVVPVLGPVEHDEALVERSTVDRNLQTHRASRNFRSYWYHHREDFAEFRRLLASSWPGMDISEPVLAGDGRVVHMFFTEERRTRELFWAGFGFQIWCQLLTHIVRNRNATCVVVDEPETYLHADLQRRVLSILRDAGPDVIAATHSSELICEADASEVALIGPTRRSALRARSNVDVQRVLSSLGSLQNTVLTAIAKSRRVLCVEGQDASILTRLAKRVGLSDLADLRGVAVVPLGGFPILEHLRGFVSGLIQALGVGVRVAALFDQDYRPPEELSDYAERASKFGVTVVFHGRKELENHLIDVGALQRAWRGAALERSRRTGVPPRELNDLDRIVNAELDARRERVMGQTVARRQEYFHRRSGKDSATIIDEALRTVERDWTAQRGRERLVPGKEVFTSVIRTIQEKTGVSLTQRMIIEEIQSADFDPVLLSALGELDVFRQTPVEEGAG